MLKAEQLKQWRKANPEKVAAQQQTQYQRHKEKIKEYQREYNIRNKETVRSKKRVRWHNVTDNEREERKEKRRNSTLIRRYGISAIEYDVLVVKQGGVCALCKIPDKTGAYGILDVDHCHRTGKVRGLLCVSCNHALGVLGDSREGLLKALEYIDDYRV